MYIDIEFQLKNDFIYYFNELCRLYISTLYEKEFFRVIYDDN